MKMETALTLHRQLSASWPTTSLPIPSLTWLTTLIPSNTTRVPPLPSLLATARLRLLSSDLSTPGLLDPQWVAAHTFPASLTRQQAQAQQQQVTGRGRGPGAGSAKDKEQQVLDRDVVVQVLDIENLNRSKWEVVEELESIERGEQTRGRQVIRLPTGHSSSEEVDDDGLDLGDGATTQTQQAAAQNSTLAQQAAQAKERERKNATHKLVVQDCAGQRLFALELCRVDEIGVPQFVNGKMIGGTPIGCKILLKRGTKVARGVVLLEPGLVKVLGGRVEGWGRVWEAGRLERLRGEVQRQ
ncbi:hypothetical protein QBC32DRAFT_262491 [Pseudoneurospora amorphoporcata]|uniref:RecQ mediated genome instability protein 1-like N-terminal helical domain-containing protein n=1 Tax=Pseudoneurospora amorphoporcata TaxID=241081 RepID=A0AAN6NSU5_9PEZI|nr:hypothetical protein QBC32DRAFT_262491 [Pseudoneurospora amorphoporcata]